MKALSILSHKGGVGKTTIAINLAVHLAKNGNRTCLIENDIRGPSLSTWWNPKVAWLNDYLLGNASLDKCLQDVSSTLDLPGKLFVGFTDPSPETVETIIGFDEKTQMMMLENLVKAKNLLKKQPFWVDYLIIDCSPGIGRSAINAMLVADSSLFIVRLSNADMIGTIRMIRVLFKHLKKRTLILANLIPKDFVNDKRKKVMAQMLIERNFMEYIGTSSIVQFLGWMPIDEVLLGIEFEEALKHLNGETSSRVIYTLDQPEHLFSTTLVDLIPVLFDEPGKTE